MHIENGNVSFTQYTNKRASLNPQKKSCAEIAVKHSILYDSTFVFSLVKVSGGLAHVSHAHVAFMKTLVMCEIWHPQALYPWWLNIPIPSYSSPRWSCSHFICTYVTFGTMCVTCVFHFTLIRFVRNFGSTLRFLLLIEFWERIFMLLQHRYKAK